MNALAFPDELESAGEAQALTMVPVGAVAHRFVHDRAYIRTIMGPFGSAKTTTCIQAAIMATLWQTPDRNGVRHSRGWITRPTYGQLQDTVMKDWFAWFPKTRDNWNGDRLEHNITLDVPGVGLLHMEVGFRACEDRKKAEQIFKGAQLTWLWPNEIDTQDPGILEFGLPRLGRYPSSSMGGCAWYGMFADMNAPDIDNWTYELLVEKDMKLSPEVVEAMRAQLGKDFRIEFFRQPGGMEPDAENLMNLPRGYYERLMIGKSENWVNRFVNNQFGAVRNGQPVYPEYNDEFHCAKGELRPLAGVPIGMAVDGGSTPAAVFGQRDENLGQVRVLAELVVHAPNADSALEKLGPRSFGKLAGEFWKEHYARSQWSGGCYDPAAGYGDEYAASWAREFWAGFAESVPEARRWSWKPAPVKGNRLIERIEGVRRHLTNAPGGKPGLLIANTCKMLRRGFNNGYVITRTQLSNGMGRWKDEPLKNDYSHVHDALQYLVALLTKRGAMADPEARLAGDPRRQGKRPKHKLDFGDSPFAHRATAPR